MKVLINKYCILICIVFTIGCKSTKESFKGKAPKRSTSELIHALEKHNFDYVWYSSKADVQVKSPDFKISGDMRLRIKKDSLIWIVGKKLGVEGVRLQILPNDYAAIFRLENTYQKGSINQISNQLGIPFQFEDLQNVLVGNIMLIDSSMINLKQKVKHQYLIQSNFDGLDITYYINAFNLRLDKINLIDNNARNVQISYKDYKKKDDVELAHHISIIYNDPYNPSELHLKFKDIELNTPKKTPFSIPSHYDRVY